MLFITSKSQARRHGVYAFEKPAPLVITPTGTGVAALVEQQSWGPAGVVTQAPSFAALLNMIAPPGMNRTNPGYMAATGKAFPTFKFVRVLGSAAVVASVDIPESGAEPDDIIRVTAKYAGTEGNAITITISAATDGDANHVNITASVAGDSGSYEETIANFNASGVGAPTPLSQAEKNALVLVGDVTVLTAGVPEAGSYSLTSGANGTIDAARYVGTAGTGNHGVARFEGDKTIDHIFTGDPGNSLRAGVNAGLVAHANSMGDRVAYLNGPSGNTAAQAQSDVANYRSQRAVYCDPWCFSYDDVDGTKRLVTTASFAASVASQLSPSTSIAWKDPIVGDMLRGIVDLEADRGDLAAANTAAGIATFIAEEGGGFRIEAGVTTIAPQAPARKNLTRTRMGHYMARSIKESVRSSVDAPNVRENQQDIIDAITAFMEQLKRASASSRVNFEPHVIDYRIEDISASNSSSDIAAGDFNVDLSAQESSSMERIFINLNHGETVQITAD